MTRYTISKVENMNPKDSDGNSSAEPVVVRCDCCGKEISKKAYHMSNGHILGNECAKTLTSSWITDNFVVDNGQLMKREWLVGQGWTSLPLTKSDRRLYSYYTGTIVPFIAA